MGIHSVSPRLARAHLLKAHTQSVYRHIGNAGAIASAMAQARRAANTAASAAASAKAAGASSAAAAAASASSHALASSQVIGCNDDQ